MVWTFHLPVALTESSDAMGTSWWLRHSEVLLVACVKHQGLLSNSDQTYAKPWMFHPQTDQNHVSCMCFFLSFIYMFYLVTFFPPNPSIDEKKNNISTVNSSFPDLNDGILFHMFTGFAPIFAGQKQPPPSSQGMMTYSLCLCSAQIYMTCKGEAWRSGVTRRAVVSSLQSGSS